MLAGTLFALVAGLMWGIVFLSPQLLPDYPAALQSAGRYLTFGLIALALGWFDRRALARLTRSDWLGALELAAIGNLVYYLCLAAAIQRAGGPLPTMIIGTLPVVIAIAANWRDAGRDGRIAWRLLALPLAAILAGIGCVNHAEWQRLQATAGADIGRYASGALLAIAAVACWTWYPLRNADWLRAHPDRQPRIWATAQGVATLPLALVAYLGLLAWYGATGTGVEAPAGPRPLVFVGLMVIIGFTASWLGTLCWNEASQRLPSVLVGQLIVFETLSALAYTYLYRGRWPEPLTAVGIGLLIAGVLGALRQRPALPASPEHAQAGEVLQPVADRLRSSDRD